MRECNISISQRIGTIIININNKWHSYTVTRCKRVRIENDYYSLDSFKRIQAPVRVLECVWNGSLLHVGAGAYNRGYESVVQLLRLYHVFIFFNIRVPVYVGNNSVRVLVGRVRWHRVRKSGSHVDGRSTVHLFGRHDRHPKRVVLT